MSEATTNEVTNPSETTENYTQDLEFSDSSALSGNQPAYNNLDDFIVSSEKPSDESELGTETDSENSNLISLEDAAIAVAGGVEFVESWISETYQFPVQIEDEKRQEVVTSGAKLFKKYFPNTEFPSWLKGWEDEVKFGLALGSCGFSIYLQKKAHDKKIIEAQKATEQSEVLANGHQSE